MRTFLALAAICTLVTGAAVTPAHAISITFSTEASLNGGSFSIHPSLTMWPNTGWLEFTGLTNATADTDFGTLSLGSFKVSGTYGATSQTGAPNPLPFTIRINHSGGSDTVDGSLSGSFGVAGVPSGVTSDWSTLTVTFADSVVALDGFVYTVHAMSAPLYHDNPQSVTASVIATPEPATLLLVGTALGLTGLAGLVRRKMR